MLNMTANAIDPAKAPAMLHYGWLGVFTYLPAYLIYVSPAWGWFGRSWQRTRSKVLRVLLYVAVGTVYLLAANQAVMSAWRYLAPKVATSSQMAAEPTPPRTPDAMPAPGPKADSSVGGRAKAPPKPLKQDVGLKFVGASDVSFEIWCLSEITVRDPKYYFVLIDMDAPKEMVDGTLLSQILPIPASSLAGDFIRAGGHLLRRSLVASFPAVNQIVKSGHRVVGYANVTCPDCVTERWYWLYFIHGERGWYMEMNESTKKTPVSALSLHADELVKELEFEHNGISIQ